MFKKSFNWPWLGRPPEGSEGRPVEGNEGRPVEGNEGRPVEGNEGRPVEGNEGRPVEGNEGRPVEGNEGRVEGNEGRPVEGNEGRPVEGNEGRPVEGNEGRVEGDEGREGIEGRLTEGRLGEGRLTEGRLGEGRLTEGRLIEGDRLGDGRLIPPPPRDAPPPPRPRADTSSLHSKPVKTAREQAMKKCLMDNMRFTSIVRTTSSLAMTSNKGETQRYLRRMITSSMLGSNVPSTTRLIFCQAYEFSSIGLKMLVKDPVDPSANVATD